MSAYAQSRYRRLLVPLLSLIAVIGFCGYVFMGKNGRWWAGQMVMSDPQPILDALSSLSYIP